MKARAIHHVAPRKVAIGHASLRPLAADEVLIRTLYSAISPGTESLVFEGRLPAGLPLDARIAGLDAGVFGPLGGHRDYRNANSKGTRGVMVVYTLDEGVIYWIKAPLSWRSSDRYFAVVDPEGNILRMDREAALKWAREHWV